MLKSPDISVQERQEHDRRERPTRAMSGHWLIGRRKGGRREEERHNVYVDRYTRGELFLVMGVLALSILDMVLTLQHLAVGGTEANPIMAWALDSGGDALFKIVKIATTVVGLGVLLIHVRFRKVKALLTFAFVLYSAVFLFHMYLVLLRSVPELAT